MAGRSIEVDREESASNRGRPNREGADSLKVITGHLSSILRVLHDDRAASQAMQKDMHDLLGRVESLMQNEEVHRKETRDIFDRLTQLEKAVASKRHEEATTRSRGSSGSGYRDFVAAEMMSLGGGYSPAASGYVSRYGRRSESRAVSPLGSASGDDLDLAGGMDSPIADVGNSPYVATPGGGNSPYSSTISSPGSPGVGSSPSYGSADLRRSNSPNEQEQENYEDCMEDEEGTSENGEESTGGEEEEEESSEDEEEVLARPTRAKKAANRSAYSLRGKSGMFKCNDCGVSFTFRHNLYRHRRNKRGVTSHSRGKSGLFKCTYCDMSYTFRHNLYRHRRKSHVEEGTSCRSF